MKQFSTTTYFQWRVALEHWGMPIMAILAFAFVELSSAIFRLDTVAITWVGLASFCMQVVGIFAILKAKMPAYRAGHYTSFGVCSVPPPLVACYVFGRRVFFAGVLLGALLLLALRH